MIRPSTLPSWFVATYYKMSWEGNEITKRRNRLPTLRKDFPRKRGSEGTMPTTPTPAPLALLRLGDEISMKDTKDEIESVIIPLQLQSFHKIGRRSKARNRRQGSTAPTALDTADRVGILRRMKESVLVGNRIARIDHG